MRNRAEREAAALARLKDPARSQGNRIPGGPLVPSGITRMSGLSARNEFGERVQPIVAAEVVAASGEDGQEATCGGEEDGQEASCGGEEDGQEASCGGEEDGQEATCGSEEAEQMMVGEDGEQCQRHRREKTKWTAFSAVQESMATGPDALQAGEISLNAPEQLRQWRDCPSTMDRFLQHFLPGRRKRAMDELWDAELPQSWHKFKQMVAAIPQAYPQAAVAGELSEQLRVAAQAKAASRDRKRPRGEPECGDSAAPPGEPGETVISYDLNKSLAQYDQEVKEAGRQLGLATRAKDSAAATLRIQYDTLKKERDALKTALQTGSLDKPT